MPVVIPSAAQAPAAPAGAGPVAGPVPARSGAGPRARRVLPAVLLIAGLAAAAVALRVQPGGARLTTWWDDLAQLLLAAAACAGCAWGARLGPASTRPTCALLSLATGAWALGQAWWCRIELLGSGQPPFPSLADAGFLAFPVLAALALLRWPAAPVDRRQRARLLLDGGVVATSLFVVGWATSLGAAAHSAGNDRLGLVIGIAYPAGDLVLITLTLALLGRTPTERGTPVLLLLGLVAMAGADSAFVVVQAQRTYDHWTVLDTGWYAAFALLAWFGLRVARPAPSGRSSRVAAAERPAHERSPGWWRVLLPYLPLALAAGVVLVPAASAKTVNRVELVAGLLLLVLVLVRQALTLTENVRLVEVVRASERELRHRAHHDALTGLANRAVFLDALDAAVARRDAPAPGVVFLDLDGFKAVNDTLGHAAGDALLVAVARRVDAVLRPGDLVARLGGDEFAVLPEAASDPDVVARRLVDAFEEPFAVELTGTEGEAVVTAVPHVRASVGVALGGPGVDATELLRRADAAMYAVKRDGGHGQVRYDESRDGAGRGVTLRSELRAVLEGDPRAGVLRVAYQPLVDVRTGRVVAVEALARWQHPRRGDVAPAVFVPLAEEAGLVAALDAHVLEVACTAVAGWARLPGGEDLRLSVNVSAHTLAAPGLADRVVATARARGLAVDRLVVEVTEDVLAGSVEGATATLEQLAAAGVRVALDDFGSGWSSLSRLHRFPISTVKVDRSFTSSAGGPSERGFDVLAAVLQLGRSLGLQTVVEGVEVQAELDAVRVLGADLAQGYLLARPCAAEAVPALLSGASLTPSRGAAAASR